MTFSLTYQYALFAIIPPTPQLKGFIQQLISFLAGDLFAYSPSIITCSLQVRIASMAVAWENSQHFVTPPLVSHEMTSER